MSRADGGCLTLVVCAAPLAERAPEVVRVLLDVGWAVQVAVTPAATDWVDHNAIREVSGAPVASDYRSPGEPKRGTRPDAVVVAPLTFNTLNKWAAGAADNYALGLLNEALGAGLPLVAVPFINDRLWGHPALAPNIEMLTSRGVTFVDPRSGSTECGPVLSGTGADVAKSFDPQWLAKHIR